MKDLTTPKEIFMILSIILSTVLFTGFIGYATHKNWDKATSILIDFAVLTIISVYLLQS